MKQVAMMNLYAVASSMGISPDEIMALMDYGCERDEIEELLYDPSLLHEIRSRITLCLLIRKGLHKCYN